MKILNRGISGDTSEGVLNWLDEVIGASPKNRVSHDWRQRPPDGCAGPAGRREYQFNRPDPRATKNPRRTANDAMSKPQRSMRFFLDVISDLRCSDPAITQAEPTQRLDLQLMASPLTPTLAAVKMLPPALRSHRRPSSQLGCPALGTLERPRGPRLRRKNNCEFRAAVIALLLARCLHCRNIQTK